METTAFNLEERLIHFAVKVLALVEMLPMTQGAQVLATQLARSCTSAALNYGEAQASESSRDFLHKMSVCLKELRESLVSLKIIKYKPYFFHADLDLGLKECNELVAIFVTSIRTKKRNMQR